MSRTHAVALILAAAVASASPAAAQDPAAARPVTFGVSGGLSLPVGSLGDAVSAGFNAGAHLAFRPATLPFGVRVEGQFNRFSYEESVAADGNLRIISGTVNAVFGVPTASSTFRPYLIGGVGLYNSKASFRSATGGGTGSGTDVGLNGGGGLEFGLSGLAAFAEARFNSVFTTGSNTNYIPISFGVRF